MSTAVPSAAPAVLQRANSSSRRTAPSSSSTTSYNNTASDYTSNIAAISPALRATGSHSRTTSQSFREDSTALAGQSELPQKPLPRRNFETSNAARPPSGRQSSSRDRSSSTRNHTRTESNRGSTHRSSSKTAHDALAIPTESMAPSVTTNGTSTLQPPGLAGMTGDRRSTSGCTNFRKRTTIEGASGVWTLGKTIGAGSMGKVKLAKKLETGEQVAVKIVPRHTLDDGHANNRDRERQDHSKEVRTAREAAIVSLLDHPYICAMRDVQRTHYHWYMLFEYVNGGQMLDYIISHGRLKDKQARKFGRQMASALDYCHRNSIIHRDLKIENILISKTGDIKIIDFGLSNLFSPKNHLKTFCGSLYFAAPELLQARQYTGPEVDIWSFGIVLYVLVCGKVPFDDQSMPKLHAKIKRGIVDYPQWLSLECKSLISRMLVTDPTKRASLHEIMTHPWMCKGFNAPPENYLPYREPLRLPLDEEVVKGMTGFDFGDSAFISRELTKVLESEEYQNALRSFSRDRDPSLSQPMGTNEKRRGFAGFDFYKRRSSMTSRETLINTSAEQIPTGLDPINAFNPLISIYYLVREKQQRKRREATAGATGAPSSPGKSALSVADLPAPEAAYTNSSTYEMAGEKPTGGRTRARARTHGEDEVTEAIQKLEIGGVSRSQGPPASTAAPELTTKKGNVAVGLLRRFSTRRNKEAEPRRPTGPTLAVQAADELAPPPRRNFSIRKSRDRDAPPVTPLHAGASQPHHDLVPAPETEASKARRGSALGRSTSVNSADYRTQRRPSDHVDVPASVTFHDPPLTSGSDGSHVEAQRSRASDSMSRQKELSNLNPRSATTRTKSLGHARRESIQARRQRREEAREANLPEETDRELAASGASGIDVAGSGPDRAENVRPVYLKGLFSVSTTSPKPVAAIRSEILRVLRQLAVESTEIRGGFQCKHTPSIDLNKIVDQEPPSPERATYAAHTAGHRRKISFGGFRSQGSDREDTRESSRSQPPLGHEKRRGVPGESSPGGSDGSDLSVGREKRAVGETTTHVQSELGGSMILNFEIIIVKVPILALHGLQFKRLSGGTWQYKNMADQILKELRL